MLVVAKGEGFGGGMERRLGTSRRKLLYREENHQEVLPYMRLYSKSYDCLLEKEKCAHT